MSVWGNIRRQADGKMERKEDISIESLQQKITELKVDIDCLLEDNKRLRQMIHDTNERLRGTHFYRPNLRI